MKSPTLTFVRMGQPETPKPPASRIDGYGSGTAPPGGTSEMSCSTRLMVVSVGVDGMWSLRVAFEAVWQS
jgi:hypothetical protein